MPLSAPKICNKAGCFKVIRDACYCDEHKQEQQPFKDMNVLPEQRRFYNSKAWEKLRDAFRIDNPFCVQCEKENKVKLAEHIDHIKPIRTHWHLRLTWSNLQALCINCHSTKTSRAKIKVDEKK